MNATVRVEDAEMSWDDAMRKARRLEWWTVATQVVTVVLVAAVSGQSQAMKAAWLEDTLSLLPPLAFIVAARRIRKHPDLDHPYGFHRSVGVGHLVAAVSLFAMGAYLAIDSVMKLVTAERAPIGLTVLGGHAIWAGWLMVVIMVVTSVPPIVLGRIKMRYAEPLHDKVLYADAYMNKANWQSGLATVLGVLGIGVGWWWADAVAAILVSVGIIHDSARNVRDAIAGLTDVRARTYDDRRVHPLVSRVEELALAEGWVAQARARVRDQGHVFHTELFVIPHEGRAPSLDQLSALHRALTELDWKLTDVAVVPVVEFPTVIRESLPG